MPFICLRRTDIPAGILQIKDLWPSKSQYSPSQGPKPQGPRYMSAPQNDLVVTAAGAGSSFSIVGAPKGLAAYLIANVQNTAGGTPALTAAQANTIAAAIVARMRTGASLLASDVNTLIGATAAASGISGVGGSTAVLTDILRILAGGRYSLPAGYLVQTTGGAFVPAPAGFNTAHFDATKFVDVMTADSSFYISLAQGDISGFYGPTFAYKGITSPALVVYANDGSLM